MLTMTQVYDIRKLYFEEGKNISQIAKMTGFDRKTVRNFLKKDDFNSPVPSAARIVGYPKLDVYYFWQCASLQQESFCLSDMCLR